MIQPDEIIRADDFINESEADATPANNEGRVAKLEDDGKISPFFIKGLDIFAIAGENIDGSSTPKAVFIAKNNQTPTKIVNVATTPTTAITIDQTQRASQVFLNTDFDFITEVKWGSGQSGIDLDDNLYVEIYAVDGSDYPTGSALASKVFNQTDFLDGDSICVFDTPASVSRNTKYAVVMRALTTSSADDYTFNRTTLNPSSIYPNTVKFFNGSWADSGNYANNFYVKGLQDHTEGKIYKSDKDISQRAVVDGFITKNYLEDDEVVVFTNVVDGFSGLTIAQKYYLENDGDLDSTGDIIACFAISATKVKFRKNVSIGTQITIFSYPSDSNTNQDTYEIENDGFIFGTLNSTGSTGATAEIQYIDDNESLNFTVVSVSNNESNSFCMPVKKGARLVIDGNDLSSNCFFVSLIV